jgi:4-hydroxy-tetrahydrodipicolinate synthase
MIGLTKRRCTALSGIIVSNPSTAGDQPNALAAWRNLADLPRLLFAEPSPAPIKRWLWRNGLIDSPEVRLPMMSVSDVLAARIDGVIAAQRSTGQ